MSETLNWEYLESLEPEQTINKGSIEWRVAAVRQEAASIFLMITRPLAPGHTSLRSKNFSRTNIHELLEFLTVQDAPSSNTLIQNDEDEEELDYDIAARA